MLPSSRCVDLIRTYEGLRLKAYPDPGTGGDPWTIGYGSTGPDIRPGTVWTLDQAKARLASDVTKFAAGVARIAGNCTQGQFDALVSFAYNCGLANLTGSTLLKKHVAGDHVGAAAEFGKWIKGGGKVLTGLVTRRAEEARLYRS